MRELEPYEELEVKFAEWNQLDPQGMVACSSGTAALHLALEAMNDKSAGNVLVPDMTMVACPRAVTLSDKTPKFIDCGDNLLLRTFPILAREHLNGSIDMIMTVNVYGRTPDRDYVAQVKQEQNWQWIEDLAESHGVQPHTSTDAACWSFYKNKIVAGEEGGVVWFRDPEHAKRARQLRSLGFTDAHNFNHVPRGHNYRMSNAHAKLILPSLAEADQNLAKRRQVEQWYNAKVPKEWQMPPRDVVWVYDLRIPGMTSEQQDKLVRGLNQKNVAARHCFKPMTTMEEWRSQQPVSPNALRLSREVVYLPANHWLTEWDVSRIVNDLLEVYQSL